MKSTLLLIILFNLGDRFLETKKQTYYYYWGNY